MAERYHDMVDFMKLRIKKNIPLTIKERNILSVAYKCVIGKERTTIRILDSLE